MVKPTVKISDTARAMLTLASTRTDRLVRPPQLPVAAARQVVRSLLNNSFAKEVPAFTDDAEYHWRADEHGTVLVLRATEAGLAVIGQAASPPDMPQTIEAFTQVVMGLLAEDGCIPTILEEDEVRTMLGDGSANGRPTACVAGDILTWLVETGAEAEEAAEAANAGTTGAGTPDEATVAREAAVAVEAPHATPAQPVKANRLNTLRHAAAEVLEAWDSRDSQQHGLSEAIERLRATLAEPLSQRTFGMKRTPREGTKQQQVLAMLRRPEGATVAQIAEAMNWVPHTVRGLFAGLKKKGTTVVAAERVREVGIGPDKPGTKGSFTIYRVIEVG